MRATPDLDRKIRRRWVWLMPLCGGLLGAALSACSTTVAAVQSTNGACPTSAPNLCSDGGLCCPDEFAFCCQGTSMCGANGPACQSVTPSDGTAADAGS